MPDWFKTFFDTYATTLGGIGAIATVLALLWGFFIYGNPRAERPASSSGKPNARNRSWIVRAVRGAWIRAVRGLRFVLRLLQRTAHKVWYGALYYVPGIKYELPVQEDVVDDALAASMRESAVFFSERFADAFPVIRDLTIYTRTSEIAHRLGILLRPPLAVWTKGRTCCSIPIWWFGGLGNMHIQRWTQIKPRLFLMDIYELDIVRIVAIPGMVYWQNCVYVECRALPPTGLYGPLPDKLVGLPDRSPSAEEYAVYGHRIFMRQEYDDAGYERRGRVKHFEHSPQLRRRNIVPSNFLIAPVLTPANVSALDRQLAVKLTECLRNPEAVRGLAEWLLTLPKRERHGG